MTRESLIENITTTLGWIQRYSDSRDPVTCIPGELAECNHQTCRSYPDRVHDRIHPAFPYHVRDFGQGHFHPRRLDSLLHSARSSEIRETCSDETYYLTDLDVDAIEQTFLDRLQAGPRWGFWQRLLGNDSGSNTETFVCSNLVIYLLESGGLERYVGCRPLLSDIAEESRAIITPPFWSSLYIMFADYLLSLLYLVRPFFSMTCSFTVAELMCLPKLIWGGNNSSCVAIEWVLKKLLDPLLALDILAEGGEISWNYFTTQGQYFFKKLCDDARPCIPQLFIKVGNMILSWVMKYGWCRLLGTVSLVASVLFGCAVIARNYIHIKIGTPKRVSDLFNRVSGTFFNISNCDGVARPDALGSARLSASPLLSP